MGAPPCATRPRLFDSTSALAHARARELCATCTMLDACRDALELAKRETPRGKPGPSGTWAGERVSGLWRRAG